MTLVPFVKQRAVQWVLLNVGGMVTYVCLASHLWVPASHFGEPGGPGDAFYAVFTLFPVLVFFGALDSVAFVVIIRRIQQRAQTACALCTWFAVMSVWVSVLLFDRLMAFNIIDARYS